MSDKSGELENTTMNYFYLSDKKKITDSLENDTVNITKNIYKDYIVIQCEGLNIKVDKLNNEVNELKKINQELEKENDKYDERNRYVKSVIHNFASMKIDYENLFTHSNNITNILGNFTVNLYNYIIISFCALTIYYTMLYIYNVYSFEEIIKIIITYVIINSFVAVYLQINLSKFKSILSKYTQYTKHIAIEKKKLEKIYDSQKYIEDYIDNLC